MSSKSTEAFPTIIAFFDRDNIEVQIYRHIADEKLNLPGEWVVSLATRRLGKGPSFSITHRDVDFTAALTMALVDLEMYLNMWPKHTASEKTAVTSLQLADDLIAAIEDALNVPSTKD